MRHCIWDAEDAGSSPVYYTNGVCGVIGQHTSLARRSSGFKSLILHTMFSCFHNIELLLEPSFGQLEVKETVLSMLLSSVV